MKRKMNSTPKTRDEAYAIYQRALGTKRLVLDDETADANVAAARRALLLAIAKQSRAVRAHQADGSDDEAVQDAENNLWEELQNRDNR